LEISAELDFYKSPLDTSFEMGGSPCGLLFFYIRQADWDEEEEQKKNYWYWLDTISLSFLCATILKNEKCYYLYS
jgi:hypothetical protein